MKFRFKLKSFILIVYTFIGFNIYGQYSYISTDTSSSIGVKLIEGRDIDNANFIEVKLGKNKTIKYTPNDLKEYGFKNGRVYISKQITHDDNSRKVFLERLASGNTTLFYYRDKQIKRFYIEKDSSLFLEIPKGNKNDSNYHIKLSDLTSDCSNIADAAKIVKYNKESMTKFFRRYNDCVLKPFPRLKFGPIFGNEYAKLISLSEGDYIKALGIKYDGAFMMGLFIDKPIESSDFSLHNEIYFSKHGYSYNKFIYGKEIDFVANISSLKIPVLIRYAYPSNKIRPFINVGGLMAFNLEIEEFLLEAEKSNNTIEIVRYGASSFIAKNQIGWAIGGGFEYKLNFKNSLFFELRYNRLPSNENTLKESIINIITGINI